MVNPGDVAPLEAPRFQPFARFLVILGSIHVAQHTSVWIDVMPLPLSYKFGAQMLCRIRHFADSPMERRDDRLSAFSSINGREWFGTSSVRGMIICPFGIIVRARKQCTHSA